MSCEPRRLEPCCLWYMQLCKGTHYAKTRLAGPSGTSLEDLGRHGATNGWGRSSVNGMFDSPPSCIRPGRCGCRLLVCRAAGWGKKNPWRLQSCLIDSSNLAIANRSKVTLWWGQHINIPVDRFMNGWWQRHVCKLQTDAYSVRIHTADNALRAGTNRKHISASYRRRKLTVPIGNKTFATLWAEEISNAVQNSHTWSFREQ